MNEELEFAEMDGERWMSEWSEKHSPPFIDAVKMMGKRVRVLDDLYEDGIEVVVWKGEVGLVRSLSGAEFVLVEFELGRVLSLHERCVEIVK